MYFYIVTVYSMPLLPETCSIIFSFKFKNSTFLLFPKHFSFCFYVPANVLFLNLNDKIIEQEMNKLAIHTHVIFRPRNAMFLLLNNYVFPDWQR